jgi:hypothetical protein
LTEVHTSYPPPQHFTFQKQSQTYRQAISNSQLATSSGEDP